MNIIRRIAALLVLSAFALSATGPIQITSILSLTSTGVKTSLNISGQYVTQSGTKYVQAVMNVPTTAGGTAIPVSVLANLGYAMFINLDPTNYVEILNSVSGAVVIKLMPGDVAMFRFDPAVTAPALLAHTAACQVQYLILEN